MIFGKTRLELKVGVFVFIGMILMALFVLSIGGIRTWTAHYQVRFIFNFVNGVKIGAPVRFAGVDVGVVKDIKFQLDPQEGKNKVHVLCSVKRNVKIPLDSTVWVNTLGLLGEKYIEVIPGKDYSVILDEDDQITGEDPVPIHEVTQLAKGIAKNIAESLERIKNKEGTLGKLMYEDTIYEELEAFIIDLRRNPWKLFWKSKEK
ncbi:MAG: MlaD family protein [Candidatus Omnitrophota bacterium]